MKPRHTIFGSVLALLIVANAGVLEAARYGLMVGIDHYDPAYGPSELPSCVNDANGFRAQLLTDTVRWQADGVITLTDGSATKSAVRGVLTQFASVAEAGDVVVYYHSSHGGSYGGLDAFVCTYDANYRDDEIAADLAGFADGVTVIVVVDACRSGGLFKTAGVTGFPEWNLAASVMDKLNRAKANSAGTTKGADVGWLTACNYDEDCWAGNPYSLFTKYVIEAFGHGDANGDGQVTFGEIFDYAAPPATAVNAAQTAQLANEPLLDATVAAGLPEAVGLGDALEASRLNWTVGGSAAWFGQNAVTYDLIDAGRSGAVGDDQVSWVQTTVEGPGVITFWWSVSSEATYDVLSFAVDGVVQKSISGAKSWSQWSAEIPAGSHTLRWSYQKDYSVSSGEDCGWIDQAVWLPAGNCRIPLNMAGRWAGIQVWDETARQWILSKNRYAPTEVVVPDMMPGRWYWVGIWDFSSARYIYSSWTGRLQ